MAEDTTAQEISDLEQSFHGITTQFEFLDKIGEGTFSCVYRAVDLQRDHWDNSWERECVPGKEGIVAVKRIHATSSPTRIANELEILSALSHSRFVSHVITALRQGDQVLLVMPYISFTDFRQIYRWCNIHETRPYIQQLLQALEFVHDQGVIHRDIKPTNFLYNSETRQGVLVDFGLAEFESNNDEGTCLCAHGGYNLPRSGTLRGQGGYHKDDHRPSRRANRAGTRGFRAPEVLLKCTRQTCRIDVWAAGVILLMMLAHRFPFFNSLDDSEALVELATIFGRGRIQKCALMHGAVFECTIPSIREQGWPLEDVVAFCREKDVRAGMMDPSDGNADEAAAMDLLKRLMEPDVRRRPSASEALKHPFFVGTRD